MPFCKTCKHPDRDTIDQRIVAGTPLRFLSAQFGLSLGALHRHKQDCLKQALADAMRASQGERAGQASDLLQRVQRLADEAQTILETAKTSGNLKAATAAICAAVRCLELFGRLDGSLAQPNAPGIHLTSINVTSVNYSDDDLGWAQMVGEATRGFSVAELMRLKAIAQSQSCDIDVIPASHRIENTNV